MRLFIYQISIWRKIYNDFIINQDIEGNNIRKNLIANHVFKTILDSENIKEKEKNIILRCNFFDPTNSTNSFIEFYYKTKLNQISKDPFILGNQFLKIFYC